MSTSSQRKVRTPRRSRKPHASHRHGAAPAHASRRPDPRVRTYVSVIAALDATGWRVTELRPLIDHGPTLWSVTIKRVDLAASMTVTAPDPDVAFEELARYAAADA